MQGARVKVMSGLTRKIRFSQKSKIDLRFTMYDLRRTIERQGHG